MHLWKGDKKFGQGPPPRPLLDKIQKNSNFFFRETFPYKVRQFGKVKVHLDNLATLVVNILSMQKIIAPPINAVWNSIW